uniref:Uncharacterized protein n=1 Tax=Arundo donax TaxID=35708 RepID=A0A0A9CT90_ARUDO
MQEGMQEDIFHVKSCLCIPGGRCRRRRRGRWRPSATWKALSAMT